MNLLCVIYCKEHVAKLQIKLVIMAEAPRNIKRFNVGGRGDSLKFGVGRGGALKIVLYFITFFCLF